VQYLVKKPQPEETRPAVGESESKGGEHGEAGKDSAKAPEVKPQPEKSHKE
jgi:hypothetical protein